MRSFFIVFVLFLIPTIPAHAQDYMQKFNQKCEAAGQTASFCSCAVNALSDRMRRNDEKDLEEYKAYLKTNTDVLLADPVMTQAKINAVCELYDVAQSYDIKATSVKREQGPDHAREWTDKKLAAMEQKEELVMSYGASNKTNGTLISGDYCRLNYEANQMSRDLAESSDGIYVKTRRMMEGQYRLSPFFASAHQARCK